jgi:hypothetical protein
VSTPDRCPRCLVLEGALRKFALGHTDDCRGWFEVDDVGPMRFVDEDCDCGFNELMAGLPDDEQEGDR